jgi:Phage integrase, N-terminal SAM-like domain
MESQKKNTPKFRPNPGLKLMDQVREVLRYHHYAYRTEQTYGQWILRYIHHFGGKTHPNTEASPQLSNYAQNVGNQGMLLEQFSECLG